MNCPSCNTEIDRFTGCPVCLEKRTRELAELLGLQLEVAELSGRIWDDRYGRDLGHGWRGAYVTLSRLFFEIGQCRSWKSIAERLASAMGFTIHAIGNDRWLSRDDQAYWRSKFLGRPWREIAEHLDRFSVGLERLPEVARRAA